MLVVVMFNLEPHRMFNGRNPAHSVIFNLLGEGFAVDSRLGFRGAALGVVTMLSAEGVLTGDLGEFADPIGRRVILPGACAFGIVTRDQAAQGIIGHAGFLTLGVDL